MQSSKEVAKMTPEEVKGRLRSFCCGSLLGVALTSAFFLGLIAVLRNGQEQQPVIGIAAPSIGLDAAAPSAAPLVQGGPLRMASQVATRRKTPAVEADVLESQKCLSSIKGGVLKALGTAVGCGKSLRLEHVVFADPAEGRELGELLVGMGSLEFLKSCGVKGHIDEMACCVAQCSSFPQCSGDFLRSKGWDSGTRGVVLFQGGKWGAAHRARLQLLELLADGFPEARFVSLPRAATYESGELERQDSERLQSVAVRSQARHVLAWRGRESLELGRRLFPLYENILVPDMAFMLHPLRPPRTEPTLDVIVATLGENSTKLRSLLRGWSSAATEVSEGWETAYSLLGSRRSRNSSSSGLKNFLKGRVRMCRDFLSLGRCVATEELHMSLLSLLMGKPAFFVESPQESTSGVLEAAYALAAGHCTAGMRKPQSTATLVEAAGQCFAQRTRLEDAARAARGGRTSEGVGKDLLVLVRSHAPSPGILRRIRSLAEGLEANLPSALFVLSIDETGLEANERTSAPFLDAGQVHRFVWGDVQKRFPLLPSSATGRNYQVEPIILSTEWANASGRLRPGATVWMLEDDVLLCGSFSEIVRAHAGDGSDLLTSTVYYTDRTKWFYHDNGTAAFLKRYPAESRLRGFEFVRRFSARLLSHISNLVTQGVTAVSEMFPVTVCLQDGFRLGAFRPQFLGAWWWSLRILPWEEEDTCENATTMNHAAKGVSHFHRKGPGPD